MPKGTLTTRQDCLDFITGCLVMGTGGGGNPVEGMEMFDEALADGLELRWIDAADVADDALTACAFSMGSIAPADAATTKLLADLRVDESMAADHTAEAVHLLGEHLGTPVTCLVAAELGGHNSPAAIVTAARLGVEVVDGDYAGRAIPDEMQTTPFAHGLPSAPFTSVDLFGNTAIVTQVANPYMLERVGKMLSVAGVLGTTMAATPLSGETMKSVVVADTFTQCLSIGRAARLAVETGNDPVAAVVAETKGWRLFDGVVTSKQWEDRDGYMYGTLEIDGSGPYGGEQLRVWLKNENHVTWLDGEPWIHSPDLVSILNPATGSGITNTDIAEGDPVSVIGIRGLDILRTPHLLTTATGPAYYGFDLPYTPIEDLLT